MAAIAAFRLLCRVRSTSPALRRPIDEKLGELAFQPLRDCHSSFFQQKAAAKGGLAAIDDVNLGATREGSI
jgi:hypothetical protein